MKLKKGIQHKLLYLQSMEQKDVFLFCNLKELENYNDNDKYKDGPEDEYAAKPKATITTEDLNQLATQLKIFSVKIAELGGDFGLVSTAVSDAEDDLRHVFRKMNNVNNA